MPRYTLDLWRVVEFDAPDDEAAVAWTRAAVVAAEGGTPGASVVEHEAEARRKVGRAQVHYEFAGAEAA